MDGGLQLYAPDGRRLYLNGSERNSFLETARRSPERTRLLCEVMAYSGCRISEALSLSVQSFQVQTGVVSVRSLKKRGKIVFREIPLPPSVVEELHDFFENHTARLWPMSRQTAWRHLKHVMGVAGIDGPQANPKGLRHAFGIHAIASNVPLHMLQRWLGHADMKTTAIYAQAVGPEERQIAARMW
ncbi:tyrosine-type recombinase/integrase [Roseibium album]|uniref:tyrosine-type recombinase/integrase n=1 Tax=Roseibium album TaxID=311410 RepID=UPI003BAF9C68